MKRLIALLALLFLLAFPTLALAQAPTDEPTPEATADPIIVDNKDGVTVNLPETQPTEINVEQAESPLNIPVLLGVFAAGAVFLAAGLKIYQAKGGNVAATITDIAHSSEFAALLREAQNVTPPQVAQQILDISKEGIALNRALGELLTAVTENLSKPK